MEEAIIEEKDSDEEGFLQLNPLAAEATPQEAKTQSSRYLFDPNDWQLEVERAIPALKVQLSSSSKDWRYRLDQMLQLRDAMGSIQSELSARRYSSHLSITAATKWSHNTYCIVSTCVQLLLWPIPKDCPRVSVIHRLDIMQCLVVTTW